MNVLLILMPVALMLGVGFTAAFVFAVRSGQFDDLETPAHRVLLDDGESLQPARGSAERNSNECRI
jgi:cbb3-type cytochrome oxidase maturation protein